MKTPPSQTVVRTAVLPTKDRSLQILAASMFVAAMMAMTWFGAPPVPALVGALGSGGILLWRRRRR